MIKSGFFQYSTLVYAMIVIVAGELTHEADALAPSLTLDLSAVPGLEVPTRRMLDSEPSVWQASLPLF